MLVSFRAASVADERTFLPMMEALWAHEGIPFDAAAIRAALAVLFSDPGLGRVWLALVEDAVAGYAMGTWGFSTEQGGRFLLLDELFVLPEFRGRGVGAATLALRRAGGGAGGRGRRPDRGLGGERAGPGALPRSRVRRPASPVPRQAARRSGTNRPDRTTGRGPALHSPRGTFETVPLRRIEIEGFRGIRRMTLELDDTTALIGENSCGKTSVLDALELALAHRATVPFFGPLDFHVPNAPGAAPVERISLRFTFLESERHEIVAEIVATRTPDGSPARAIPRLVDREGRELHAGDPAAFEAFRRRHPVLRVRFGRPARPAPAEAPGPADTPSSFPGYDALGSRPTRPLRWKAR